jgi:hypothetical protein
MSAFNRVMVFYVRRVSSPRNAGSHATCAAPPILSSITAMPANDRPHPPPPYANQAITGDLVTAAGHLDQLARDMPIGAAPRFPHSSPRPAA